MAPELRSETSMQQQSATNLFEATISTLNQAVLLANVGAALFHANTFVEAALLKAALKLAAPICEYFTRAAYFGNKFLHCLRALGRGFAPA